MALGLPVVSTNVGGLPYLLEDKKDAYLVNSGDVKAMVSSITKILEGKSSVDDVVRNARQK